MLDMRYEFEEMGTLLCFAMEWFNINYFSGTNGHPKGWEVEIAYIAFTRKELKPTERSIGHVRAPFTVGIRSMVDGGCHGEKAGGEWNRKGDTPLDVPSVRPHCKIKPLLRY